MDFLVNSLERMGQLYEQWFADWLHIHYIVRTVVLLLAVWLAVFLIASIFRYIVGPLVILILCHTVFRAWNFLFVETPQEIIYIKQHKDGVPNYSNLYLRFTDRVKKNRNTLKHYRYMAALRSAKRFGLQLMITGFITSTLWIAGFGLYHEFVHGIGIPNNANRDEAFVPPTVGVETGNVADQYNDQEPSIEESMEDPELLTPQNWFIGDDLVFVLNESGRQGARLHDGPGITGQTIIEILWDDVELVYLNFYESDPYVDGLYWLRVLTPGDRVGYISSHLVEVLD